MVFSSFICLCVLDGVSYTFGMFLQPLTDDLGIPLGATSMVGSLQVGRQCSNCTRGSQVAVTCVSGVVSARVVVALGPRPVAMVGALLASAGLLAARWVPTLDSTHLGGSQYMKLKVFQLESVSGLLTSSFAPFAC